MIFFSFRGLLSAHVLAVALKPEVPVLQWYNGELLAMAEDLGRRLLPAFNTSTGIPHGRVNISCFITLLHMIHIRLIDFIIKHENKYKMTSKHNFNQIQNTKYFNSGFVYSGVYLYMLSADR